METIVIDEELGKKAAKVFEKMGLNLNSAINIFLEESVKQGEYSLTTALKNASNSLEGVAKGAGMPNVEDFEEYFFKEFRPSFLEKWKKEKGYA